MTDAAEAGMLEQLRSNDPLENAADQAANGEKPEHIRQGFCDRLTLEPVLAGAMMAIFLAQTSLQNFYLRTACSVDLHFPSSVCERGVGKEFQEAEIASQQLVSQINVSRGFVGALISTCVLLFLGPWSDCSRRRKPLLVVSLLGMSIATLNVLIMVTFPIFSSVWVLYLVQIPMSLGGNFGLLLAAGFSYIGDVCHASGKNVTMTMGKHRAAVQCASVVGALAGPLLYRCLGFYGVFPIVFSLQVSALVFVLCRVHDVRVNTENRVSVLDVRLPVAAVRCLLEPRHHHRRKIVLLMMLVALADRTILASEVLLWYMYARKKYQWDDITFGGYLAYRNIISFIGTLLILRLLKARLRLSDELVGALSGVSLAAATACLIAARSTLAVFFVPLVAIIAQGSQVVQRPILNKQIETTEQGKIYSVVGALEQACQTAISPLFSLLYSHTVENAPDAWLAPCLLMGFVQMGSFLFARRFVREQEAAIPDKPTTLEIDQNVQSNFVNGVKEVQSVADHNVQRNFVHELKEVQPVADHNVQRNFVHEFKEVQPVDGAWELRDSKLNYVGRSYEDVTGADTNGIVSARNNSLVNESTENLRTELQEELKCILKAIDESVAG